jgi:PhnB protein
MVRWRPEGYPTLTPGFCVRGAAQAIDFYTRAFGARERMRLLAPDGATVAHAELTVGDALVMLGEEDPGRGDRSAKTLGGSAVNFYVYVEDVDAAFARAIAAGATSVQPVADMFWGDRVGTLEDPFGQRWTLATHTEDVTPEEIGRRVRAMTAGAGGTA